MGWKDLLQTADEKITSPWLGGRSLRSGEREWDIGGKLPAENGWYLFKLTGRKARLEGPTEAQSELLHHTVKGYLVGDRIVPDDARVDPDPKRIIAFSEAVHLIEPGLDRFVRVSAGRVFEDGPLVYQGQEMPLGTEEDVLKAFLDEVPSVDKVTGIPPALDAAFRMETWQRAEAERRRIELERLRREEEERLQREDKRRKLVAQLGDAAGRREMAKVDFPAAARAALAVGGAQFLDHRRAVRGGEMVVRFRYERQRFECTCDETTLRIIDSGICLVDHGSGERGDTFFTLESLPGVIHQAQREGRLVIFRHVD